MRIHYPALKIRPKHARIVLPAPHGFVHRERPEGDKFHLDRYPPDYVYNLAPTSGTKAQSALQGDALRLYCNTEPLGQTDGVTILSVLPVYFEDEPIIFLFRHESYFGHNAGYATVGEGEEARAVREDYRLSETDFESLLQSGAPWVSSLEDLVLRKSDQACLHVEAALRSRHKKRIDADAACSEGPWETKTARRPHKILKARLDEIAQDCSYPGDGTEQMALPCGHVLTYDSRSIRNADPAELETAACPDCGIQIMN